MKKNASFKGGITRTVETLKPERPEDDLGIRHIPLPPNDESANKNGVYGDFLFEGFDGTKIVHFGLDEEAKNRLSSKGVLTPYENEDLYRFRIQVGDLVRLRDGSLGTVRMVEHIAGPNVGEYIKVVSVDVDGAPRRWFGLRAPLPVRFVGSEIHYLKFVATKEEVDASIAECNE